MKSSYNLSPSLVTSTEHFWIESHLKILNPKGSLQKKLSLLVEFGTKGERGSAGIKLTLSLFITYFFVGMVQKWSKMA